MSKTYFIAIEKFKFDQKRSKKINSTQNRLKMVQNDQKAVKIWPFPIDFNVFDFLIDILIESRSNLIGF